MKKRIIILMLLPVLFFGCKTKQQVAERAVEKSPVGVLVDKLVAASPDFSTANVSKMSLAIKLNDYNFNVSATCRISRDSLIHVSILPVLGIEAFKVEMDPDTIRVYDKFNKKLYVVDFASLNSRFGVNVDFYSLQDLISNRFFKVGSRSLTAENCKLANSGDQVNVIDYVKAPMKQRITSNASNRIVKNEISSVSSDYTFVAAYNDFAAFDNINFPQKINILVTNGKRTFTCDFSVSKATFNQKLNFSTLNPERYERADINNLLKK